MMTDQERQQLVNSLKNYKGYDRELTQLVHEAADEIERLAAELEKMGRWYNAAQKQLWAMKEKYGND